MVFVFRQGVETLANFMWNSIDFVTMKEFLNIFYLERVLKCIVKKPPALRPLFCENTDNLTDTGNGTGIT